jgi:hypothetical protein
MDEIVGDGMAVRDRVRRHGGEPTVASAGVEGDDDLKLHAATCLLSRISQLEAEGAVEPTSGPLADAKRLLQRRGRLRWVDVRQAERLVLAALTADAARVELGRRLAERDRLPRNVRAYYDRITAVFEDDDAAALANRDLHRVLLRLVEDLHGDDVAEQQKRRQLLRLRARKSRCFIVSFLLFLAGSGVFIYASVKTAELGDPMPMWLWWLKAVADPVVAVVAGLFGASFSMLRHREARGRAVDLEAVDQAASWSSLCARLWAGVGGALVLYYVLLTGYIDVPMLDSGVMQEALTVKGPPGTIANHAALVIICFVAGFSERLVPGMVDRIAGKVAPSTVERGG